MKEIGIDARMIQHTGIGTYLKGLLNGIKDLPEIPFPIQLFGDSERIPQEFSTFGFQPFHAGIYSAREQWEYLSRVGRCSLWHAPHYNVPFWGGKTKIVTTIHDLIHWIYRKEYFSPLQAAYAGIFLRRAVERSDHLIAVSENTKADIVKHFNADPGKISVIYESVSKAFVRIQPERIQKALEGLNVKDDYFLYVGLIKPHKGIDWLLKVFMKLKNEGKIKSDLVLVGKKDKRYRKGFEMLRDLSTDAGVHYFESVSGEELLALYNGAKALVHPSRYEGFGLTPLEAMACETPVVACHTASIPEITGNAAWLIRPDADRELQAALERMESDERLRSDLIAKGKVQLAKFGWDKTARQTFEVYQKALA